MTTREMAGPIGRTVAEDIHDQTRDDAEFRALWERTAVPRVIAKQIIHYRTRTGLPQQELAHKVGTSYSQISRIESGRYFTSIATLQRIGDALGLRLVVGFEHTPTRGAGE